MSRFEEQVAHRVAAHNANDTKLTTITQYGARGMQQEISRGMKFVFAKLIGGVVLAVFFVLLSFILLNRIHRRSSSRVAALTLAAGALPLMALVSAMASCSFLGLHTNSISVVALALAYAVGIDGALILYNTWIADTRRSSQVEQMAKVFSSCVPSLTAISSVAIGLLAGGLFPVEEFAGLSSYLGFTVLFVYAYQICFFTSVMAWCCPIETHRQLPQEASKPPRMPPKPVFDALLVNSPILDEQFKCRLHVISGSTERHLSDRSLSGIAGRFAHSLSSSAWLKIFATSVFCLCLALPTYIGSAKVKSNIDYRDLLPDDSPSNKGVHLMSDVVWPEFFNVLFFIENPPHFDDPVGYSRFKVSG
ncbi:unnamed protein product [Heligmosomoides polygyrus]|uniref:SSD domain-containing protein n=1 Tax=Heligmosomoides polygyrus TaxID=6339 RepID=A0A3P7Z7W1_HELPZ|nr:unnamed protein product [Heligmosomoides polygyrus]